MDASTVLSMHHVTLGHGTGALSGPIVYASHALQGISKPWEYSVQPRAYDAYVYDTK